jgi:SAM-dependent methyltransferase
VSAHESTIVDQFTRQAAPFAAAAPIGDPALIALIVAASGVRPGDRVLDVGCGPGIVTCALAAHAGRAVGLDLTPAMIERARALAGERGVEVDWIVGDLRPLPFDDGSFDVVATRFVLHHLEDPAGALAEMRRVLAPGGALVVCDVTPPEHAAAAFNEMERERDPSHVRALSEAELLELLPDALEVHRTSLGLELDTHLERSFPSDPGGRARVRAMFEDSLVDDRLGVGARLLDGRVEYAYPLVVAVVRGEAAAP